jgi:aspartate racemase
VQLEYATDLFHGETAERMLAQLEGLLRAAARSPGDRVQSLPFAGDALPARREAPAATPAPAPPQRAPRVMVGDALEAELVVMWQEVLGVRPVRIQDDFFALGGHSLLAARLFDRIERRIGQRLPIAILFQAPTVEELAEVLRRKGWASSWSSLVAIQTTGARPPLFMVHAVGGNILNYGLLSRHLGPDQPFYALQSQGLDGVHEPHDTVEEAAAHYVREIRAVQPRGPYHLGGSSSGGIMAFEMAQQLVAAGEEVGLVALIDTSLWYAVPVMGNVLKAASARRQALRLDFHLGQLLLRRVRDWPSYLAERARAKAQTLLQPEHPDAPNTLLQHVWERNHDAMARYVPRLFPGRITMLLSQDEPHRAFADPRLAWARVAAGGLVIRPIPGDHEHVLDEPIVGCVAAELRALLAGAR